MKGLTYKDDATILRLDADRYGDYTVLNDQTRIKVLFIHGMSNNHSDYVDNIGTDAHAYLDIDNPYIATHMERVEGMYLVLNRYGEDLWYKIERCKVGRTILLDNKDNNLHVFLSKCPKMAELEST